MSGYKTFGEMLLEHRKRMRLTLRDVAAKANVSRSAVWNIEREHSQSRSGKPHRPRLETIDAICDVIGADKASARMLVYPPDEQQTQVVFAGDNARLPQDGPDLDLRKTIDELLRQASAYREIALKLERTAQELGEFLD